MEKTTKLALIVVLLYFVLQSTDGQGIQPLRQQTFWQFLEPFFSTTRIVKTTTTTTRPTARRSRFSVNTRPATTATTAKPTRSLFINTRPTSSSTKQQRREDRFSSINTRPSPTTPTLSFFFINSKPTKNSHTSTFVKQTPEILSRRIVHGRPADIGEYPFAVFLELNNGEDQCGGSLLSNSWVLTAAHCLDGKIPTKILIGAHTKDGEQPEETQARTMQRKCCHKDYDDRTLANDICLVKLSSPVAFGEFIQRVKLPPANTKSPDGTTAVVMGWGLNEDFLILNELQEAEVNVVNKQQCINWYAQESRTIPDQHFCAGGGETDTCGGDSGGPLVIEENGEFILRGITSFGSEQGCGIADRPGVYTRVSSYISWINRKMSRPCAERIWTPWKKMGCSVTCGIGTEESTRECQDENGAPTSGCPGAASKTEDCIRPDCKVFSWTPWKKMGCSVTCGVGTEESSRECQEQDGTPASANKCPGEATKIETCSRPNCKEFNWTPWKKMGCSVTCGIGTEQSTRECQEQDGTPALANNCPGSATKTEGCTRPTCKEYHWSDWKKTCTVTCGSGVEEQTRNCMDESNNVVSPSLCPPGSAKTSGVCHRKPCPRTGSLTSSNDWGPWMKTCSVTCGTGTETKVRKCLNKLGLEVLPSLCSPGNAIEHGPCTMPPCGILANDWGPWTKTCSVTCGTGTETKVRKCLDNHGLEVLPSLCSPGDAIEHGPCAMPPCGTGESYRWGSWTTECSVTCGIGLETKTRKCFNQGGIKVSSSFCSPGSDTEYGSCSKSPCTSHDWGPWSTSCSVTCGEGTKTKVRKCLNQDGMQVLSQLCSPGDNVEHGSCTMPPCDSYQWGSWDVTCSVTCGVGTETRIRKCMDQNGLQVQSSQCSPGIAVDYGSCTLSPCSTHVWGPWETTCSVTCGMGTETRTRKCLDQNGLQVVSSLCSPGDDSEVKSCERSPCIAPSKYTWGPWTTYCTVTCGDGTEINFRRCLNDQGLSVTPSHCQPGSQLQRRKCSLPSCGQKNRWGPWKSTCSVTCGRGSELKSRQCLASNGQPVSPKKCQGSSNKRGFCAMSACKVAPKYRWGQWRKSCSVTCGTGIESNFRQCLDNQGLAVTSSHCYPGSELERSRCSLAPCVKQYTWSPWKVSCSVTCGQGSEVKTRQCRGSNGQPVSSNHCRGSSIQRGICARPPCQGSSILEWGRWSSWTECRVKVYQQYSCDGFRAATRDCLQFGRDVDPQRCISTIGGDYYKEESCTPYSC